MLGAVLKAVLKAVPYTAIMIGLPLISFIDWSRKGNFNHSFLADCVAIWLAAILQGGKQLLAEQTRLNLSTDLSGWQLRRVPVARCSSRCISVIAVTEDCPN